METAVIDELTDEIIANKEHVPVIGASLIPLILRAQGIEVVPSLQGGQIMPTMDRVSRVLDQVFFKTEQGLAFAVLGMAKVSQRPQVVKRKTHVHVLLVGAAVKIGAGM